MDGVTEFSGRDWESADGLDVLKEGEEEQRARKEESVGSKKQKQQQDYFF